MGSHSGCGGLLFFTPLVVWEGGQHFLEYHWLSRRGSWYSLELIHLQVYLEQLFFGCIWPYQLNSGYTHLRVQLRQGLLQPRWTTCSASFCPSAATCLNISYNMIRWWGLSSAHWSWIPRNNSTSMTLSISLTDFCSSVAHCFAA